MALRFLADHCVSNSTVQSLREAHHEVLRLKDVLPVESSDTIVIAKAQESDAILLALNGDFSHIVKVQIRGKADLLGCWEGNVQPTTQLSHFHPAYCFPLPARMKQGNRLTGVVNLRCLVPRRRG